MMLGSLICILLIGDPQATEWKPPKDPDPRAILNEAREDKEAGRYDMALAKHVWFHRNVLKLDQSYYGVRLSFALSDWADLAEVHPPARAALTRTRDEALADFRAGRGEFSGYAAFHDFEAINEKLGDEALTVATFVALDKQDPARAKEVFNIAQPALIRARQYSVYGKYVKPEEDWLEAAQLYQRGRQMEKEFGPEHARFVAESFTNKVTTLLALLVVNGRVAEAKKIADKARLEWDDSGFHAAIDSALAGVIPEPFP
jgi:hypothetical protein